MTQHELIYQYLQIHGSITPMEAFRFLGVTKLSTRVGEMKRLGIRISGEMVNVQNRRGEDCKCMRYRLT